MKIAIVHDWLTGMRGGEQVLEAILELFPEAVLFTLICDRKKVSKKILNHPIRTSWMQLIPGVFQHYQKLLPIMPFAIRSLNAKDFDLVISSSHCVAKGILKNPHAIHISYVHAPMRYIWDRYEDYFGKKNASFVVRLVAGLIRKSLQQWDFHYSQKPQVDRLMGNSHFISKKIQEHYQRDSSVVFPFVKKEEFNFPFKKREAFYLVVSALVPYKRIDLAVMVFNELGLPLKVVGSGSELTRLKKLAKSNIEFLGHQKRSVILSLYQKSRGFIFPGKEDFGITPLESMAAGVPVIAFGEGGALDTVISKTGILFSDQTQESLKKAVLKMENSFETFDPKFCREHAFEFNQKKFQTQLLNEVFNAFESRGKDSSEIKKQISKFSLESEQSVSSRPSGLESDLCQDVEVDLNQNPQP